MGGAADDGEDDAEARARDAEADRDVEELVGEWRDRSGGEDEAEGIEHGAQDDGLSVTEFFCERAEDRLPDPPGEVLDRDGERKLGAGPAKLLGHRDLEDSECCADREADEDHDASGDQDRRDEGSGAGHEPSVCRAPGCVNRALAPSVVLRRDRAQDDAASALGWGALSLDP